MKDPNDQATADMLVPTREGKRPVGRPVRYASDEERKAARAHAARERRAREKAEGFVEVRRLVKRRDLPLNSDVIDLSAIPEHRRR